MDISTIVKHELDRCLENLSQLPLERPRLVLKLYISTSNTKDPVPHYAFDVSLHMIARILVKGCIRIFFTQALDFLTKISHPHQQDELETSNKPLF